MDVTVYPQPDHLQGFTCMGKLYLVEFCTCSACKPMRLCDKHMDDVSLDMLLQASTQAPPQLERSLRTRRHEPAVKHISLLKSKPRCYTQSINVHTVLFYNCMTILTMLIVYLVQSQYKLPMSITPIIFVVDIWDNQ